MVKYEKAALKGDLGGLDAKDDDKGNPKGKVIDLILPVAVLICTCIVGMIYIGGFWGPAETILGEDAVDNSFNFINAFAVFKSSQIKLSFTAFSYNSAPFSVAMLT